MRSALPRRHSHVRYLAACIAMLAAAGAHADDSAAIARIEAGLRPEIALADLPVPPLTLVDAMKRLNVPGVSVAVIKDGKVAWTRGYGVAWTGGPAVTPQTLFQAASLSKPVAAMAALRMVEQGKLDLDAGIDQALTSWTLPKGDGMPSLRQLLSHTGGMSVSGFPGYAADKSVPTLQQVLDGAGPANTKAIRVNAAPGSAFRYSGGGYTVVQQAMIDRAGQPFDATMQALVLAPLGMTASTYAQPLPASLAPNAARPHDEDGKPYPGGAYTYPEQAAAGLWSTPQDLARFAIAIQQGAAGATGGVLTPAMTRAMLQPVKNNYALGLSIEDSGKGFSHGGSNQGFKAVIYAAVADGSGAVILTNGDNGIDVAAGLMRAIAYEYKWDTNQTKLRKAVALAPETRRTLVGRYQLDAVTDFEIAERKGELVIRQRGGQWEPLYAESDKVLFVLSRDLELRRYDADFGTIVQGTWVRGYARVTNTY
ncbi:CubicO group peptidase (beta-lactamase class C family) [Massilia sp. MP_M2]|uniref:serine hydrolase domain-containing protein n=1 Tax=Massilia sp. MP_M2 TaxID=3071713 RepID=UPI00319E78B2